MPQRDNYRARSWTVPAPAAAREHDYTDPYRKGYWHGAKTAVAALGQLVPAAVERPWFVWIDDLSDFAEDTDPDARPPAPPRTRE